MSQYPQFPGLSRKPALKTKGKPLDSTLRSDFANGMEDTRPKFTRSRREYTVTIEHLTAEDSARLDDFVEDVAVLGAYPFYFLDERDPSNPKQLLVRFSKCPEDTDEGWVEDQLRKSVTFELRTL